MSVTRFRCYLLPVTQSMEASLEQERLQQEAELHQKVNEEEVRQHACRFSKDRKSI